ncbi:hypothetical protein FQA39_LY06191 [Lamprigera yunnana]|nr:hypothetical protein FQA39_LY06191 [Lamprigera yunnana]
MKREKESKDFIILVDCVYERLAEATGIFSRTIKHIGRSKPEGTPISDLATADMELVHELPGPSSSTADFNFLAPISDLATADMELVHELPGPSSTNTVPSPFKKHFVPTEVSNDTKRKPKEKLPTVAFGEDYVIYLKRKMEKKENLAKQKLEQTNERKRKKAEKDALMEQKKLEREDRKRRKSQDTQAKKTRRKLCYSSDSSVKVSSAESDIDDEETDEDDSDSKLIPPKKVNGEFVIVRYDGRFYPGKIITALQFLPWREWGGYGNGQFGPTFVNTSGKTSSLP